MLGAIIGDVAGSTYEINEMHYKYKLKKIPPYEERMKVLDESTPLFLSDSTVTDDSILTCAIYDAIINGDNDYEKYLKEYGLREIKKGKDHVGRERFGPGFVDWCKGTGRRDSYGNGCAMRISPVGFMFDDLNTVIKESYSATIPTHNCVESLVAAEAVAVAILLLRRGYNKAYVYEYINKYYYKLNYDLENLRHMYTFTSRAKNSVPIALYLFFESYSFEESIRKAISIGGDTDTIAAIVGSLSEAYYGIPDDIKIQVVPYMKDYMIDLLDKRYELKKTR